MTTVQATDTLLAAYAATVQNRDGSQLRDTAAVRALCQRVAEVFTANSRRHFGIMLAGQCGNGKSTMVQAIRHALNLLSSCRAFPGEVRGLRVIDAKELLRVAADRKMFDNVASSPMLAIEDVGREAVECADYGNILTPFIDIIERRYDERLFTVITTNRTPADFRSRYGDRVADRLNEMLATIPFMAASYRTRNNEKTTT